jgi:hypothetical protein
MTEIKTSGCWPRATPTRRGPAVPDRQIKYAVMVRQQSCRELAAHHEPHAV